MASENNSPIAMKANATYQAQLALGKKWVIAQAIPSQRTDFRIVLTNTRTDSAPRRCDGGRESCGSIFMVSDG